ncbi:Sec39 domain-containing protein [Diplogelasinospora grovesii]|uniref:Sec39 domain-containing protein n=1 Tax=Diplogelasinospora grovesii TaxID=303347 RepID=A0AAN6S984_9PEZI|nr:Sec39 domain-containing protein [Diplogelasinospora grovesii]
MAVSLSPPKLVLLAVQLAVDADIHGLAFLAARHGAVLRKDLLLRILLTYLPETIQSSNYVGLIEELETEDAEPRTADAPDIDLSAVEKLTEEEATRKLRKLRLLPLTFEDAPIETTEDPTTLFLLRRSYKVDEETGLLDELPDLLVPFLDHSPCIRTLMVSTILPLLRRNFEYHPHDPVPHTLSSFQQLPDRVAVNLLLSQTGVRDDDLAHVGRDLRGMIGPWLFNEKRWPGRKRSQDDPDEPNPASEGADEGPCPGWEQVLEWLTAKASKNWRVAVSAIEQWEGPGDVDLGGWGAMWLSDEEQEHLEHTYARAALASAYLIPEASVEALEGAHKIVAKIASMIDQDTDARDSITSLQAVVVDLPSLAEHGIAELAYPKNATYMRNSLLDIANPLTTPTKSATDLLQALVLSAFLLARGGSSCAVRRAGELALLHDEREQKAEALKLIHTISNNGPKTDDKFWIRARNEILWLRDWGAENNTPSSPEPVGKGVFGQLKREFLEVEILKALLANTRYTLARNIYEDSPEQPISRKMLQDTIIAAAMTAYENASNPNRTRGGLKKCNDIVKALPKTLEKSMAATQRIEALLRATHALSEYRLVLKQGEPFTPVVLRVRSDPISVIGKILEQNPKSYTRITDLLDVGANMVQAGLTVPNKSLTAEQEPAELLRAERRITAMCIDAALIEDDFETAYSFVVSRLSAIPTPTTTTTSTSSVTAAVTVPRHSAVVVADDYSWKAALQAGKYRRTAYTIRPTHLGTASGNPEIRHLEQRIECLATALRIAPAATLQEILNAYRRTEEELDSAIQAEAQEEDAWDQAGDSMILPGMPGTFNNSNPSLARPVVMGGGVARGQQQQHHHGQSSSSSRGEKQQQAEEAAPMSLFDLSRASVLSAQRNLTALASLQQLGRSTTTTTTTTTPAKQTAKQPAGGGGWGVGGGGAQAQAQAQAQAMARIGSAGSASGGSGGEDGQQGEQQKRMRKRDQLREAAMGTLVSGVGWLINAPPPSSP